MWTIVSDLLSSTLLPRVEDPWPETIGLGLPFTLAGAGGVLAGVLFISAPPPRRDRLIAAGGLAGFLAGGVLYMVALIIQIGWGS